MSLAVLEKYDRQTATDILAAAALASGQNVEGEEPKLVKVYANEVRELLAQIRQEFRITDSETKEARLVISNYLTKEIQRNLFAETDVNEALAAAGQAGRLNPAIYTVEQPPTFINLFSLLSIKRSHIDQAVKHPDDHQHILDARADDASKGTISLFVKRITKSENDHWLLVQTHRDGLKQIAQSAWRVFPDTVDLSEAEKPIDLLKEFVEVFGIEINVGGITGKFIESIPVKKGTDVAFSFPFTGPFFCSISRTQTNDPDIVQVGATYCIDTLKYAMLLERKKFIPHESVVTLERFGPAKRPTIL